jgi:hypothetical protein
MYHTAESVVRNRKIGVAIAEMMRCEADGRTMKQQPDEMNALANLLWEGVVEGMAADWLSNLVRINVVSHLYNLHSLVEECRTTVGRVGGCIDAVGGGTSFREGVPTGPVGLTTDVPEVAQSMVTWEINGAVGDAAAPVEARSWEDSLSLPELGAADMGDVAVAGSVLVGGGQTVNTEHFLEGQQRLADWARGQWVVPEGRAMVVKEVAPGLVDGLDGSSRAHIDLDTAVVAAAGEGARYMLVPPEIMVQWCAVCDRWYYSKSDKITHDRRKHRR